MTGRLAGLPRVFHGCACVHDRFGFGVDLGSETEVVGPFVVVGRPARERHFDDLPPLAVTGRDDRCFPLVCGEADEPAGGVTGDVDDVLRGDGQRQ